MTRRREFPSSVKREAWDRCLDPSGTPRCEECTARLGDANTHYGERLDGEFDHDLADALLGEPVLENCVVRCRACHLRKTSRDRKVIARSNHTRDSARGIKRRTSRSIIGSKASGIKLRFNGPPIDRSTGLPWGSR